VPNKLQFILTHLSKSRANEAGGTVVILSSVGLG